MKFKLHIASLFTLSILSGFVVAILLAIAYFTTDVSWQFVIGFIIVWNILMWLLNPYIQDLVYKWFYKIEFFDYEQIKDKHYAKFLKKACDKHKIKVPRIGIIRDRNPTAFTYGSTAFNARIVVTDGLFEFLDEREVEAVFAHELGHIVNKDFIIMSIAATLLEILYEIYVIFARSRTRSSSFGSYGKKGERKGNILILIGYVSYFFYWLGTYLLLYLSRVREYYADEFSAKETGDPNLLSSALIKIAYGIASVPDTEKTAHLLNNTRAQGIFDLKVANDIGLVYINSKGKKDAIEKSLLFDVMSPWAWIFQLKSTHPLTGKRIKRLSGMTQKPLYNFDRLSYSGVDKKKIWGNFFSDFAIHYLPAFVIIAYIAYIIIGFFYDLGYSFIAVTGIFFFTLLAALILKIMYKFSTSGFESSTIIDCMGDVYASPIRGRPVKLSGKAIGRGQAGFVFGEDMIFQDSTGIIYLNYESAVPFFGNLFFAWKKLEKLFNQKAEATGWFFRGATHHLELYNFKTNDGDIHSYVRFWYVFGTVLSVLIFGFLIFMLAMALNITAITSIAG